MSRSIEIGPSLGRRIEGETKHVKRAEVGFDPAFRDRLEEITGYPGNDIRAEWLREALAGVVFHLSLEHIPRLVHDQITCGRDSYSAQSLRYVTMRIEEGNSQQMHSSETFANYGVLNEFNELAHVSAENYKKMLGLGIPKEDARFCLLWGIDSNVVTTLQGPKIVDFVLENLNSPYSGVRNVAGEVVSVFGGEFPRTAERLIEIAQKVRFSTREQQQLESLREKLYGSGGEMSVNWLTATDPSVMTAVAARTCYQGRSPSEFAGRYSTEQQQTFVAQTFSSGHTSIAEHPHFMVRFAMSEAGIQQLRRHRIPVQKAKPIWEVAEGWYSLVCPPSIEQNKEAKALLAEVWEKSVGFRLLGTGRGIPLPELDYGVVMAIQVPAFLVTNATDIVHIGERRLCERAQWEVRDWTYSLAETLIKSADPLFRKLGPACYSVGKCPEGDRACGHPEKFRDWRAKIQ